MRYKGIIFDLDGVLVSTDSYHYKAWKRLADEEGIEFNKDVNNRLRGVSRMESLEIILEKACKLYSSKEKDDLAARKNRYYVGSLQDLGPEAVLPGANETVDKLKDGGYLLAVGSSSRNTSLILDKTGLANKFNAVADGNEISQSKPHPEVFLLAAKKLGLLTDECVVVEDAAAGIDAAISAGMMPIAVGEAVNSSHSAIKLNSLDDLPDILKKENSFEGI